MTTIEKLTTLIKELAVKNGFPDDRIQVYRDDNGKIGIDIDKGDWSNCLSYNEAEDQIYNLFKGIELCSK